MVYIIRQAGTDIVKIGYSKNKKTIRHRLNSLQTANPNMLEVEATIHGSRLKEACLHHLAVSRHIRGEWFRLTKPEVRRMVAKYAEWKPHRDGIGKMPSLKDSLRHDHLMQDALAALDPNQETPISRRSREERKAARKEAKRKLRESKK